MTTQPQLQYVQCANPRGGHRMAFWAWGDAANSKVLICVHGLSRQGRDFDTLAQALCDDYRVICPDVVGRGRSDWLQDPMGYQVPQYVGDMLTLIATLKAGGATSIDWVGTSMGGLIGLGVAALPQSPIPVGRFVINDIGPRLEPAAITRIGSYMGRAARWATLGEAADALWAISTSFGPHTREQWLALTEPQLMDDAKEGQGGFKLRADPGIAVPFKAATPEAAAGGEALLWQAWDHVHSRTLITRGAESDLLSRETALAMTQRGPRAKLIEFAGVGHAPTFVPDDQIAVVREFLRSP
jgi:pimeloyl-ACP methyl ester carboxylesterase